MVCHSVRPSVLPSICYVFCHYAQQGGQEAIPTGSVPHWLDPKKGGFCKNTTFKSYGVQSKSTSQYASEHGLPRPDSACFGHGGGSRSNMKGEYVVLVCQKHIPNDVASLCVHCFREAGIASCVSVHVPHAYSRYNYVHPRTYACVCEDVGVYTPTAPRDSTLVSFITCSN